ncbi:MAG: DNA-processing protein DprA [Thermodesulfobacteriota bacterium]
MASHTNPNWLEWLTLRFIPGLGNVACKNLIGRFGSPGAVFRASPKELLEVEGIREDTAERIAGRQCSADPAGIMEAVTAEGARIVPYTDPNYPPALREIHDPPVLLYLKGRDIPSRVIFVGVVGSRNPTPYGLRTAERIGQGLARRGLGVASGLARGIDSAAHWGCLEGRGFALAVLGTGIDILYPESNQKLYLRVLERGAVVTEFPPGTPPEPWNFPARNRIISGLSRAVVVVEATLKSGSLITASLALEQGRDVFAVPGSVHSFKSQGCHSLIKQGARLIENADDILEELGLNDGYHAKTDTFRETPLPPMEKKEQAVFGLLGDYPVHIDEIAREGKLEPGEVSSILTKMELKGLIRQLPGKLFIR